MKKACRAAWLHCPEVRTPRGTESGVHRTIGSARRPRHDRAGFRNAA